jgi:hypothetical protein
MRPIGRDVFATLLVAAATGIYTVYLRHTTGWIVSGTRETTALVLVLGTAVCGLGQTDDLYPGKHRRATALYELWTWLLGVTALIAAVIGTIGGSATALAVLFGATVLLWASATLRHAYAAEPDSRASAAGAGSDRDLDLRFEVPIDADFPPEGPVRGPRTHEVIEPESHYSTKETRR